MNVGLVGCGRVSDEHMKAWRRVRQARVTAVCDTIEERAARVAEAWDVPSHYTDLETMIRHEKLEYLSICTPPNSHVEAVSEAIAAGVNVVVEKPLAMTVKEVEQIGQVSKGSTARLMVVSNLLFAPAAARANHVLESLRQQPVSVDVQFFKESDDNFISDSTHWCHKLPGGIFGEILFHPLYLIRFFLGDLQIKAVYVERIGKHDWMPYDELTVFLGSLQSQARIRISCNSLRYRSFLDLYGQKNAIRAELKTNDTYMFRDPDKRWTAKGFEVLRQNFMSLESGLRLVPDAALFHLGVHHTTHELNIKAFVDNHASVKSRVLTLEDAYKITQLQEEITTLIDKHRGEH